MNLPQIILRKLPQTRNNLLGYKCLYTTPLCQKNPQDTSSSSSSSSDDEAPKKKASNADAVARLNSLLQKIVVDDAVKAKSEVKLAMPTNKRLEGRQEKEKDAAQSAEKQVIKAVKDVAENIGGDIKQTESELLMKLLNPVENRDSASSNLSDILKGMKIEREAKPQPSRAEQVKSVLNYVSSKQRRQDAPMSQRRPKQLSTPIIDQRPLCNAKNLETPMDPTEDMCKSLVKWLQKLVPNHTRNISEICDGVGIVEALLHIEPGYFGKLEPKIKKDVGTNWRLRVSNLKKIAEAVLEYFQDVLNLQILEGGKPDVNKIGESNDAVQLAKLLRLVLGCAINCERKQEYITLMMEMEESIQQNIMQAIQQLEEVTGGPGRSGLSLLILDSDARVAKLVADLESANEAREALTLQNQSLEQQVHILQDERRHLEQQLETLHQKESKFPDARKQMELLKEELFKAEVMRDDFKAKLFEQEKQMLTYQEKIAELQIAASDSSRLKDEVDALSESAGKVNDLEQAVASYKKRLENYQDLKKQVQKLEEKNMEYLQKNMEMEEELTKSNSWRNQCETYRNQLVELQQKLDEETQKADKAQFNLENLESKAMALQAERNRLLLERDTLREENEELKIGHVKTNESGAAVSQELTPADLKERLRFLERENKTLRGAQQELDTKQSALDQALGRSEKLQQQNRTLNQTVLKLEAQLEELRGEASAGAPNPTVTIKKLQEALSAKEHELQTAQAKHQRNLEKAREVAAQLETAESTKARGPSMGALEERLIAAAFYRLGGVLQREATDERLAVLAAQGQSFLARQRQPAPRKPQGRFNPPGRPSK